MCIKLFLHAIYANPNQRYEDFQRLCKSIIYSPFNNLKPVLMFAYNGLSNNFKDYLLYLSIFPDNTTFRRRSLVRRWIADRMITKRGSLSALVEAYCCFDVLATHRFVIPKDSDIAGKVKICTVHDFIHDIVTGIARDQKFMTTKLPPHLAQHLSVHDAVQVQFMTTKLPPRLGIAFFIKSLRALGNA